MENFIIKNCLKIKKIFLKFQDNGSKKVDNYENS